MSRQRNQNDGNLKRWMAKVDRFMNNSNMNHSAIGREGLEVYDGGWIRILNGGLQVIGTATISGTLDVTGTTNLQGQTSVTGPMEISGTTNITGNTNVIGELNVTGPTTLDGMTEVGGDFEITTGGLFKSGLTTIEPTGKATFGDVVIDPDSLLLIQTPGGSIAGSGADDIILASSESSSVTLNSVSATLDYLGVSNVSASAGRLDLKATKIWLNGAIEGSGRADWKGSSYFDGAVRFNNATFIMAALPTTTQPANLYVDPSTGRVSRSTA